MILSSVPEMGLAEGVVECGRIYVLHVIIRPSTTTPRDDGVERCWGGGMHVSCSFVSRYVRFNSVL